MQTISRKMEENAKTDRNNLAYICSPYRGSIRQKIRNTKYAKYVTHIALELGYTPIATHLYMPKLLNDKAPAQRKRALQAGKEILDSCGTIIIGAKYGISAGMESEIDAAGRKRMIIII